MLETLVVECVHGNILGVRPWGRIRRKGVHLWKSLRTFGLESYEYSGNYLEISCVILSSL
jgi:hypothetical protein